MQRSLFVFFPLLFPSSLLAGDLPPTRASKVDEIPTGGLVLHLPFDGNAEDMSGLENHAAAFGAMPTEDKFGNARSAYFLDGGSHLIAPLCISPSVMPQVTMVLWAKTDRADRHGFLLTNAQGHGSARALSMRRSTEREGVFWATSTNRDGSWIWQKTVVGEWAFLAVSFDHGSKWMQLHVNGEMYERDCTADNGGSELAIGMHPGLGNFFQGSIDEVRVYDRILTEGEIAALYRQFLHGDPPADDGASVRNGLLPVFIAAFAVFAGAVLAANIAIRRR